MARIEKSFSSLGFDNAATPVVNEGKMEKEESANKMPVVDASEKVLKGFNVEEDLANIIDKLAKSTKIKGAKSMMVNQLLKEYIIGEEVDVEKFKKEEDIFAQINSKNKIKHVQRGFQLDNEVANKIDELSVKIGKRGANSDILNEVIRKGFKDKGFLI